MLAVVAEQTGYPPELLDMDLDLEADLGVDTVKQAEVFAAIREIYGIERDDTLKLRDYPTLNHVVGFVHDRTPHTTPRRRRPAPEPAPAAAAPEPAAAAPAEPADDGVAARVLAVVAEQTGYPPELLDMDLDLEADLGVDTVKQAEVFAAIREIYGIERDDTLKLRDYPTLNHVVGFVHDRTPHTTPQRPNRNRTREPVASRPAAMDAFPRRLPVPVLRPPLDDVRRDRRDPRRGRPRRASCPTPAASPRRWRSGWRSAASRCCRSTPRSTATPLERRLAEWAAAGPIQGVYWLPALDEEGPLAGLAPDGGDRGAARPRQAARRHDARAGRADRGAGSFLVSATRLGGRHGYDADGAARRPRWAAPSPASPRRWRASVPTRS